jgi:nucleoside-diphosphate-sugar epimerase
MNPNTFEHVFISGGAGFIGSHLARRLLATPALRRLVVYDNFSSGQESYLAGLLADPRLEIVRRI